MIGMAARKGAGRGQGGRRIVGCARPCDRAHLEHIAVAATAAAAHGAPHQAACCSGGGRGNRLEDASPGKSAGNELQFVLGQFGHFGSICALKVIDAGPCGARPDARHHHELTSNLASRAGAAPPRVLHLGGSMS